MSPMTAGESETGSVEAHRLLETLTRLQEVRRRYAFDTGDGEQFTLTENCLDSIISDLDGWLKPGGRPMEFSDLDLRLAAVEEMIEATGLPAYAHVIANVRESLMVPAEDSDPEDEPPPPQRYEPPPASVVTRSTPEADMDEWEIRAAAERRSVGWGELIWPTIVGGCLAATAALLFFWPDEPPHDLLSRTDQVVLQAPEAVQPAVAPVPTSVPIPSRMKEALEFNGETLAQVAREINLAERALHNEDTNLALQHFAAAAAIDRHHRRVTDVAESLINALLKGADAAFDNSEWELAANRIDNARHIAQGLHLDTSAIDQTAQKHAAMTRFEDVTPEDPDGLHRAVGHSVRVTLTNSEIRSGRLEAFENNTLVLEVHSGFEGGRVQFSKRIPVAMVRKLRIFDAEQPSETVLGQ